METDFEFGAREDALVAAVGVWYVSYVYPAGGWTCGGCPPYLGVS